MRCGFYRTAGRERIVPARIGECSRAWIGHAGACMAPGGTSSRRSSQLPGLGSPAPMPLTSERRDPARATCQWLPWQLHRVPWTMGRGGWIRENGMGATGSQSERRKKGSVDADLDSAGCGVLVSILSSAASLYGRASRGRYLALYGNSVRIYILSPPASASSHVNLGRAIASSPHEWCSIN